MPLSRLLKRSSAAQRFLKLEPVERVVSTLLRGAIVKESARFACRELAGRRGVRRYRLRESKLWVHLRHSSPDVFTLDQAFYQRLYDPPNVVSERLGRFDRPLNVVDLGGNIGTFGLHILARYPDATVTSLEPDPENARLLAATIGANHAEASWRLIEACAAPENTTVRFSSGQFGVSGVAGDGDLTVEAVDAFPLLGDADLIKIDIEGSEWPLLADERFRRLGAAVIHLEYHERHCPESDPEGAARRSLEAAGYALVATQEGAFWAWRP